jgi:hypothetical protein
MAQLSAYRSQATCAVRSVTTTGSAKRLRVGCYTADGPVDTRFAAVFLQ